MSMCVSFQFVCLCHDLRLVLFPFFLPYFPSMKLTLLILICPLNGLQIFLVNKYYLSLLIELFLSRRCTIVLVSKIKFVLISVFLFNFSYL